MDITVHPNMGSGTDSFKFRISAEMTVAQIRAGIIRHMNIPAADQSAVTLKKYFTGSDCEIQDVDYDKTAKELGIKFLEVVQPYITLRSPESAYNVYNIASTTLAELQETVRNVFKIPDSDQLLVHDSVIIKREHYHQTLVRYGFKNGDELYVVKESTAWEVTVVHPDLVWTVNVPVTLQTTMKEIKDKVQEMTDVVINVPLYHHSKIRLDSSAILGCEGMLSFGDCLFSYQQTSGWRVNVKTLTNLAFTINNLNPADTILHLKKCIEGKQGIGPSMQRIIFAGKQLAEDHTLKVCQLRHENTVHLILQIRGCACGCLEYERRNPHDITTLYGNVRVVMPDGKSVTLDVEPVKDNIRDLKKMINKAVPTLKADRIELMFCGKLLEDNITLQEACVRNRSELKLVQLLGPSLHGLPPAMVVEFAAAIYDIYGQDMMKLIDV